MVLGLLKAEAGTVRTCGLDPFRQRRTLSGKVGYLSQKFSLYGDLSVDENVAFFAEVHDVRGYAEKRDALLEMVRMKPFRERLAARLSGGMKQKLALVSTLVHTPELLVLDEPTTGVDPVSRRDFWRLLARLAAGRAHDPAHDALLDEAERCTRVALVDHGRVLTLDTLPTRSAPRSPASSSSRGRAAPRGGGQPRAVSGVPRSRCSGSACTRRCRRPRRAPRRPRPSGWPSRCAAPGSSCTRVAPPRRRRSRTCSSARICARATAPPPR
jgi:ABC-2 type transport system ATP-binding protein